MGYKVAVVGATGNVGREMLNILAERDFPADEVIALQTPEDFFAIGEWYRNFSPTSDDEVKRALAGK